MWCPSWVPNIRDHPFLSYISLTIVLATRLLLDLQEANQRAVKVESGHDLHISQSEGSLSFARVVGSIDSFIDTGLAEEHTSDEEESGDWSDSRSGSS